MEVVARRGARAHMWCAVCNCELPCERNGTVRRDTRREHNRGQRHLANTRRIAREVEAAYERERLHVFEQLWRTREARRQALLLAVVSARLRETHGSVRNARVAWQADADAALAALASPALRAAVRPAAVAHVAQAHVCEAARNVWLVVRLVIDVGHV